MDRILFGDNQFFGINHMSEEKARQQMMRFQDIDAIMDVLRSAYETDIKVLMCTTHDRMGEVANIVRRNPGEWQGMKFYPCMPYAHKYANAVTELGYVDALRKFLPSKGILDTALKGGKALMTGEIVDMGTLLIDAEMKAFEGLDTPIVFIQNVVTDLLLGLGFYDAFRIFADHIEKKYNAEAGFVTMNMPKLLEALSSVGIERPIVCCNVNKVEFRMSGGIQTYRDATERWPARIIAMSVLASGAIPPREAIEWVVGERYVESILFGASSRRNIESTATLIREFDARVPVDA